MMEKIPSPKRRLPFMVQPYRQTATKLMPARRKKKTLEEFPGSVLFLNLL